MTAPAVGTRDTAAHVLVVNAGSSSLKYQLIEVLSGTILAAGAVERIGEPVGSSTHRVGEARVVRDLGCRSHREAFDAARDAFRTHGPDLAALDLVAIGHRVVHGGARFGAPVVVDDDVVEAVRALTPLAPLHNPASLDGIAGARASFPGIPSVAVFDTAFHQTLAPHAYTYAVPRSWQEEHGVRRYGFHGTSHAYVSRRAAALLGRPLEDVSTVVLHLGNGASACAVRGGRSIDTSMGLSTLEGLVMGTRPGDLDPALPHHMTTAAGLTLADYDRALSTESGLKGLAGSSDFREVTAMSQAGDPHARLALDVVAYRLRKYVGGYAVALGRVDALAFTGGIGEHSAALRAEVVGGLAVLGLEIDPEANACASGEARITTDSSAVAAYVIPTNEELEIARECLAVVAPTLSR